MIVNTLKLGSPGYPQIIADIPSPPPQLHYAGIKIDDWLQLPKVAVVGSRKITPYGKVVTENITGELARAGVVIISGLAYGVDITAHRAALAAGGRTVAVLAGGLDAIYPAAHRTVAERILRNGSLITEHGAGSPTFPGNFVIRNRLISGFADVLLITEAALKSGSLHTARFALEQGKTVMAVPGNITSPMSEGCNNLIKSGAVPVTSADDIFFALKLNPSARQTAIFQGSDDERLVLSYIRSGVCAQDELSAACQLAGPQLASALTMLEISGHIRPVGAGNWVTS